MALEPEVEDLLDRGQFASRELIRFDLPGKTVGYHMGGRPYTYNGLVYLPNRWLQMGDMQGDLGVAVTAREVVFANVPVDDPDDAIARIEQYQYINAPVIISHLAGEPQSNTVYGVLVSHLYEVNDVRYEDGAAGANGERTMTMTVELEAPGRSHRGATLVRRAQQEQQFDNDEHDTCLEYASTIQTVPVEWGQRSG